MAIDQDKEPESNDEIIERCLGAIAEGNSEAIGEIYEITRGGVYGLLFSYLKNAEDAEDLMQDTYVKIATSAHLYSSRGKPMAWIYTIARNLALMKLRKSTRITDIPDYEWDNITDVSDRFMSDDKLVLQAAMKHLSDNEIQIVMLHAVGGVKFREIAAVLDIPLATALSKYNRAMKKLQKLLEDDCE